MTTNSISRYQRQPPAGDTTRRRCRRADRSSQSFPQATGGAIFAGKLSRWRVSPMVTLWNGVRDAGPERDRSAAVAVRHERAAYRPIADPGRPRSARFWKPLRRLIHGRDLLTDRAAPDGEDDHGSSVRVIGLTVRASFSDSTGIFSSRASPKIGVARRSPCTSKTSPISRLCDHPQSRVFAPVGVTPIAASCCFGANGKRPRVDEVVVESARRVHGSRPTRA